MAYFLADRNCIVILPYLFQQHYGPKSGIVFLDLFPLLRDPLAFETLITCCESFQQRFGKHYYMLILPAPKSCITW